LEVGFVHLCGPYDTKELAWSRAQATFQEAAREDAIGADLPNCAVVGHFTIPPPDGECRNFQTLHIDFGLPVVPDRRTDVARFTALYVDRDGEQTTALTRIVPLWQLLSQRAWVEPALLLERFRRYGKVNTAAGVEHRAGYVEGILARLVEAADDSPTLPHSSDAGFLCGMEFESLAQERDHFAERGLNAEAVELRVLLGPGQLLLIDNLATAHGRLGVRRPLELNQLCVGFRNLDISEQSLLLGRVLGTFSSDVSEADGVPPDRAAARSMPYGAET